jgi:hypothetical protein
MISATSEPRPQGFAAHLAAKAKALAQARAEARLRQAKEDPRRWRTARLLWPLFTGDT